MVQDQAVAAAKTLFFSGQLHSQGGKLPEWIEVFGKPCR